mmetsp:Transcript_127810/g.357810  ORF Transcript_127810/g.357810 Transcript_127810/m.357810 type:complete len:256 (-) Transcript_127810:467-1234(-)
MCRTARFAGVLHPEGSSWTRGRQPTIRHDLGSHGGRPNARPARPGGHAVRNGKRICRPHIERARRRARRAAAPSSEGLPGARAPGLDGPCDAAPSVLRCAVLRLVDIQPRGDRRATLGLGRTRAAEKTAAQGGRDQGIVLAVEADARGLDVLRHVVVRRGRPPEERVRDEKLGWGHHQRKADHDDKRLYLWSRVEPTKDEVGDGRDARREHRHRDLGHGHDGQPQSQLADVAFGAELHPAARASPVHARGDAVRK